MTFYDSLHTGFWRVELNEAYIWRWLRNNRSNFTQYSINIPDLTDLVEDRINMCDFQTPVDVSEFVRQEYNKMYVKCLQENR